MDSQNQEQVQYQQNDMPQATEIDQQQAYEEQSQMNQEGNQESQKPMVGLHNDELDYLGLIVTKIGSLLKSGYNRLFPSKQG